MNGYGMYRGRADELIPGNKYRWTAADGRKCVFLGIASEIDDTGDAMIEMLDRGRVYLGSSLQLYD